MRLYKTLDLRPAQLEKIYADLGGRYTLWERLRRKRIGSPMMFYLGGNENLDRLQQLASDEIRINVELLKEGVLVRIAERTTSYFIPITKEEITDIHLTKHKEKIHLELSTNTPAYFKLWGSVDQYSGWRDFMKATFLLAKEK